MRFCALLVAVAACAHAYSLKKGGNVCPADSNCWSGPAAGKVGGGRAGEMIVDPSL